MANPDVAKLETIAACTQEPLLRDGDPVEEAVLREPGVVLAEPVGAVVAADREQQLAQRGAFAGVEAGRGITDHPAELKLPAHDHAHIPFGVAQPNSATAQLERLTDAYLGAVLSLPEYERRHGINFNSGTSLAPAARTIFTILRLVVPRTIESSTRTTRCPCRMLFTGLSFTRTPKWRIDCCGSMNVRPT